MGVLIISLPFLSAISILTLGRYIGHKGGKIISIGTLIIITSISIKTFIRYLKGEIIAINIKEWFNVGNLRGQIEIILDKESIIMINLISIVTTIVVIYSYWYLNNDPFINSFISKLLIFAVTMYIFVTSKNILLSFLGWEGVGIISFLLINYWSGRSPQNSKAGLKAIIFNRIGDIAYLISLILISTLLNNYNYSYINSSLRSLDINKNLITIIFIGLIIASMAKSAQILLHSWLGDAMAGPTPVSALLHAATMVTAGVYLIIKIKYSILLSTYLSSSYNINNLLFIIGSLTIIFAGISALSQYDIKKIIAYSTCGQIGYMYFSLGLNQPVDGSLYHLITHGFFKALLFLSAGLIIHIYINEQDLRKYGNLIVLSPFIYLFFLIGSLAIIAFPSLSGFYSKELILNHSLNNSIYYYFFLLIGSLFSSLYSFKLIFLSFFNSPKLFPINILNTHPLIKSSDYFFSSIKYLFPISILLLGSIFIGKLISNIFTSLEYIDINLESLLSSASYHFSYPENFYHLINITSTPVELNLFKLFPLFLPLFAIFLLVLTKTNIFFNSSLLYFFIPGSKKYFFDTLYNYLIISPLFSFSYHFFFKFIDRGFLEYLGPLSLFRLFFYFPKKYSLPNQSITNLPFSFFYFFFSIISFSIFYYFISPLTLSFF